MEFKPLPSFPTINIESIPPASILLFYGGPKITEWYANHRYGHIYKPAAFHASLYLGSGLHFNVGKFKTISNLVEEFKSTRRIDVVVLKDVSSTTRDFIVRNAHLDVDKPRVGFNLTTYGINDFLRFEPLLRWLPKSKHDICSENVWKRFNEVGVKVAEKPKKVEVAPWMIFDYTYIRQEAFDIKTVWIGKDFKIQ